MPDSGSREHSKEHDSHFKTTLITSLTVYNLSKLKKADKLVKVKEIDFTVTEDNYLELLTEVLKSHSQDKYKVTARRHYGFKYIYPPLKGYVTSNWCCATLTNRCIIASVMLLTLRMRRVTNKWQEISLEPDPRR
jgi:hypothetical protein